MHDEADFAQLIESADATLVQGWDFTFLDGRVDRTELPWDYEDLVRPYVRTAERLLDVTPAVARCWLGLPLRPVR